MIQGRIAITDFQRKRPLPKRNAVAPDVPVIVTSVDQKAAKRTGAVAERTPADVEPEVAAFFARMMRPPPQDEEALIWELTFQGRVPRN